ncbi:hypothetical protein LCGC14_1761210 [marine sediment metagenome]|uniref:Uncharacterized protein n=1 Tax=marine sediment metagenome TaxID=412755 RepID=A0A0F9H0Z9_9ZZZZ
MSKTDTKPFIAWEGSFYEPMLLRNTLVRIVVAYKQMKKNKLEAHLTYEWAVGLDSMGKKNWIELPEHNRHEMIPALIENLVGIQLVKPTFNAKMI